MCVCVCQRLEAGALSDAVFEVVSLQREADRTNGAHGSSLAEEEEHEEGRQPSLSLTLILSPLLSLTLISSIPSLTLSLHHFHPHSLYPFLPLNFSFISRTRLNSHTYASMLNLFSVNRVCSSILRMQT